MIRVVLDTNILVSALLQPLGPPARVFRLATSGVVQLCMSGDIFAEYEEVIRRPRFRRSDGVVEGALRIIRENAFWVRPTESIRKCADPDDDVFLECAQAAKAHYLVTGNIKDFPFPWHQTQIVTARQFLADVNDFTEDAG
jgi:putative PIN family toxin of toxin-antitoxin system